MKVEKSLRPHARQIHKGSYAQRHGAPIRQTAKVDRMLAIFRQLVGGKLVLCRLESQADRAALRGLIHQYGKGIVKHTSAHTAYLQFSPEQARKYQKARIDWQAVR